jgi:hypothetical protein
LRVVPTRILLFDQFANNLLPISLKMHYIFSLKHIVRVFKGFTLANPTAFDNNNSLIKLWHYEMSREFFDRFNSLADRKFLWKIRGSNFSKFWTKMVSNDTAAGFVNSDFQIIGQFQLENISNLLSYQKF